MDWTKILKLDGKERERIESFIEEGMTAEDVYDELETKILDVMVEVANDNFNVGASTDSFFPMTTNAGLEKLLESIMIYVEGEEKGD